MNEQILELYKQAQEFAYKNISKESWNTDNFHAVVSGKFAELIVKECMAQCAANDSNDEWDKGVRWAVNQIQQHFGVES